MINNLISPEVNIPTSAKIAEGVSIEAGALLSDGIIIGAEAIIERGAVFAGGGSDPIQIAPKARIGAGAVLGPDVAVGWGAHILPGSVVLASVPANAVVSGNPAKIIGYTRGISGQRNEAASEQEVKDHRHFVSTELKVGKSALFQMPKVSDLRGSLSVGELGDDFPFQPRRYFIVYDVPSEELRGEHAHRKCQQFLICVQGACRALLDDGNARREVVLDRPEVGLYMPAMIWGTQYRYTHDAVLIVLASHPYDASDYIRSYDDFRNEVARL